MEISNTILAWLKYQLWVLFIYYTAGTTGSGPNVANSPVTAVSITAGHLFIPMREDIDNFVKQKSMMYKSQEPGKGSSCLRPSFRVYPQRTSGPALSNRTNKVIFFTKLSLSQGNAVAIECKMVQQLTNTLVKCRLGTTECIESAMPMQALSIGASSFLPHFWMLRTFLFKLYKPTYSL